MGKLKYYCDDKRHLVCTPYSVRNLHTMAADLGIKRAWFHRDHYDVPARRSEEIRARCTVVSSREIVRIIRGLREVLTYRQLTEGEDHGFCRSMQRAMTRTVKQHTTAEQRKKAWVHRTMGQYEFHGPDKFYWNGRAHCAADAKYQGWRAWMKSKGHGAE